MQTDHQKPGGVGWAHARKLELEAAALLEAPLPGATEGALPDAKSEWLLPLVAWLREPSKVILPAEAGLSPRSPAARLWLLVRLLAARPESAARLGKVLRDLLEETTAVHLFCDAGMGGGRSFAGEAVSRLSQRLLPAAPNDRQLDEVVTLLFPDQRAARHLDALPESLLQSLYALIFPGPAPWQLLRDEMADAVIVLGERAAALGMEHEVSVRSGQHNLHASPFFILSQVCRDAAECSRAGPSREAAEAELSRVENCLSACRALLLHAVEHQERHGVSVDLVFRLERMNRQLDRIERLLGMLFPCSPETVLADGRRLLADLVFAASADRSLRSLLRGNVRQLSRKIVESAGATGEHYIAGTAREYHAMITTAAGAGVVTAFTTLVKYCLAGVQLPPFFLGVLSSLNYAVSFVLLYLLGWTLATKQPAATAATLANAMRKLENDEDLERIVELIARTTRSQLAAIAGNLGTVVPTVLLIDWLWRLGSGHAFFDAAHVEHALQSLHPFHSLLFLYAALTGVLLWMSSIGAGWVENWASYRRLSAAMARSRTLLRLLGESRRARFASAFSRNLAGLSGNVILGFLLGMAPVLGAFFGLPTEIRHVTLSTGLLAFAASALGPGEVLHSSVLLAALGIGFIGFFNFAVSFRLALWLASSACGIEPAAHARLRRAFFSQLLHNPGRFFLPPRAADRSEAYASASETRPEEG